MGNYVDLAPALSIIGRIWLWMWTTGVSLDVFGTVFDLSFGQILLGIIIVDACIVLIKAILVPGSFII